MLSSTYIHVPGVGAATERALWTQGAVTWDSYLCCPESWKVPPRHRHMLLATISDSLEALEMGRPDYFARNLAVREHWRCVEAFPRIGYLDIETDGGMSPDSITMIGLYDGFTAKIYTKDIDLAQFAFECQEFDGFVTFFGGGFDLPMLKRRFPVLENVFSDRFHVDLCPLLRVLGYRGGLKSIERQLRIARRPETEGLSGLDAVRLWRVFKTGGRNADDALHLLKLYNEEDVVNMKALLDFALPRLHKQHGIPTDCPTLSHCRVLDELAV